MLQTLKGFRDFLPTEARAREWLIGSLKHSFAKFGFEPLETPTLEYASVLTGKYGEEADKLMYLFADRGDRQVGLRYDQTVPTARVLAQYKDQLPKFFRRYQIQNVFRADKPQKGRYREFTQCDCDVFGTSSPVAQAEVLAVFYTAFMDAGLKDLVIEYNDREQLVNTVSQIISSSNDPKIDPLSIIQSIDKLDKLSAQEVTKEIMSKGLSQTEAETLLSQLDNSAPSERLLRIEQAAISLGLPSSAMKFNPKLARGLDYYTGLIFEGKLPESVGGSVGGGGEYNNLIRDLSNGAVGIPATGFAIGFDRMLAAAIERNLVKAPTGSAQVLVSLMDGSISDSLFAATKMRQAKIAVEIYPDADKLSKQFKLADQKKINFVAIIGDQEKTANKIMLKNLATGEQEMLTLDEVIARLTKSA